MHPFFSAILLWASLLLAPAAAQELDLERMTNEQIVAAAPDLHPSALYVLASRLLSEGKGQEAANWMYAGQLRYRILLAAADEAERMRQAPLFSAFNEQVGRLVNEYIAGDVDEWVAAIDFALDWDEAKKNGLVTVADHAAEIAQVRAGLVAFRDSLGERREEIAREREKNGLENR
ncbi:hypothetical protein QEZ48_16215 [Aquamicrobium lusatiense]|uniref:hypothetical protein n=1 Tax=Aquamicrobium lusatiense TaxID=89772 RepID=UPI002457BA5B|nr:hypothetical protein [Aquamicrobium lusatiense]MDH4992361.1 hypothetical protein [Aquamicrobium lusatiense]